MTSSADLFDEAAQQYQKTLQDLAGKVPAYGYLKEFMGKPGLGQRSSAQISIINFTEDSAPEFNDPITDDELQKCVEDMRPGTLFVVENVSAKVIKILGTACNVEYDFWLQQINEAKWFLLGEIEEHLPPLRSKQIDSRYVRYQFISPREVNLNPDQSDGHNLEAEEDITNVARDAALLRSTKRLPHRSSTGSKSEECFADMALTTQHISVWFDTPAEGGMWRTGVCISRNQTLYT